MTASNSRPIDRLALAAALTTVVLWASAFVGIRAVAAELTPGSITLGRLLIASIALGALVAARPWIRPTRRELALIVGSGLIWFVVYNLALNEAERNVDAGTAAMLVNTGPIFIAIMAGAFLGEGFPGRLLLGCAIAFVGTLIISIATSTGEVTGDASIGIALCILAAFAYAAGVTLQKPAVRRIPGHQVTWLACVTGTIACLPFAPDLVNQVAAATPTNVAWLVYLGLFPTAIAFTTWAFALSRTTAGRLGAMTYLVAPVVIVMAWLLLGESPPALAIAGGVLCIAGVAVARSTRSFVPRLRTA